MSEDQKSKSQGVFSFLFDELRGAIQDIRQKVVEEGWFGRVATAAPVIDIDHTLGRERGGLYSSDHRALGTSEPTPSERRPSFEEAWRARPLGEQPESITKDQSIGIDR